MSARETFDLVVVGAGTAGCIVAARAADTGASVLLLEAGPDYPDLAGLPADLRNGNNNSYVAHDWGLAYQPRSDGGSMPFPRGKVVGGSSAVNTCIALRGEPDDYDEWAAMAGPEWAWEKCLPAFVRLEADADFGSRPYHGADGPLPIKRYRPDELQPTQAAFLEACDTLGLPSCPDHNAPRTQGYGPTPMNKRDDDRVSLAEAYLHPRRGLANLTIRAGALVRRVTFEGPRAGQGRKAAGVELADGSTVSASRVVLSGGSIMTPPLLVRSGIGAEAVLRRLSIEPVVVRDGVGARLFDHPGTLVLFAAKPGVCDFRSPLMQTCMRLQVRDPGDLFVEPLSFAGSRRDAATAGIAVAAYRSFGVGRLTIDSADPAASPRVECCFFDEGDDLHIMAEGVRLAARLSAAQPLAGLHEGLIGLDDATLRDDDTLREHIRRFCGSGFHPVGTAPMGREGDPLAVCDQYGRVYGTEGLRVADASLMPTVPRANTNIPTAMIGERIGEWLAADLRG